ncbi:type II secretion system F family protein [Candidatus Saccharibacteria bacterium]|nr:type II secretion system F family protein [Candidatus Saccharibacteria bacterium]
MKKYKYKARDQANNKIIESTVQADSEKVAAKLLLDQGFVPISLKEEDDSSGLFAKFTNRVTSKDKVVYSRQLATLIGAGLPLSQSLRTVSEQTNNKKLREISETITSSVEGGKSLSESFGKFPEVFDPIFLSLMAAGEVSGSLDKALQRIAAQQEKDAAMMSKIKGAMTYPVIVLFVMLGVIIFMLISVVPQVEKLYQDFNQELPLLTKVMVGTANFIVDYWWIVLIVGIAVVYFGRQFFRTDSGIKTKDTFKLNVPLFSPMFRKLYMARLARTSQTLLASGVSMLDTLEIVGKAMNNSVLSESIERAADKVKGGKALSVSLSDEDYILTLVPQMIKIGEQSGKIDEMFGKLAQIYEDELDEQIKTISTAIEPVLMVLLALVAGGMVGAILFPIYSLVNGVGL